MTLDTRDGPRTDAEPQPQPQPPEPTPESPPTPARRMRGFGRTANLLLAYTLTVGIRLSLFNLALPLYLYSLGYRQDAIGLVTAAGALTTLVIAVPLGVVADRVGRGRLFVWSAWVLPWPYLLVALSENFAAIVVGVMIANGVATVYWSTNAPLLVNAVGAERRVSLFAANAFLLTGVGTLGALLGGGLAALAGGVLGASPNAAGPLRVAMLAMVAVSLIGAVPLLWFRPPSGNAAERRAAWRLSRSDAPLFARLIAVDALISFAAGAVVGFLPLFFAVRYGLTSDRIGVLFTVAGVLSGIASLLAPALARRAGELRALIGVLLAMAPAILLLALAPTVAVALLFEATRTALRGTLDPILPPFTLTRVPPAQRGVLGSLYNVTWATGFSLGPLASGAIQVQAGFTPAFAMSAACYLLAAALAWTFFRNSRAVED